MLLSVASLVGYASSVAIVGLKSLQIVPSAVVAGHISTTSHSMTLRSPSHVILMIAGVLEVVLLLMAGLRKIKRCQGIAAATAHSLLMRHL